MSSSTHRLNLKNQNTFNTHYFKPIGGNKRIKTDEKTKKLLKSMKEDFYYHGTSTKSAADINKYGMTIDGKKAGATARASKILGYTVDFQAAKYHYFTKDLETACKYAKDHKKPAIVKLILPKNRFNHIERDTEDANGFKIKENISLTYIVEERIDSDQLSRLSGYFNVPLEKNEMDSVKTEVNRFISDKKKICTEQLSDTKDGMASLMTMTESENVANDFHQMKKIGIDLLQLKPGDIINL